MRRTRPVGWLLRRLRSESFLRRPDSSARARRARRQRMVAVTCQCHRGCAGGLCPCNSLALADERSP